MSDTRRRLEDLGVRLDALAKEVRSTGAGTPSALTQSLRFLRQQWDGLREDMEAVETLGGGPGDDMMAAVEQSLADLEKAYAEAEARFQPRRTE